MIHPKELRNLQKRSNIYIRSKVRGSYGNDLIDTRFLRALVADGTSRGHTATTSAKTRAGQSRRMGRSTTSSKSRSVRLPRTRARSSERTAT